AQGLGSIGAVPEPLIAGVVTDSCNRSNARVRSAEPGTVQLQSKHPVNPLGGLSARLGGS
ncbi:MAG: hypothetical protein WCP86_07770, partial [bacterium]